MSSSTIFDSKWLDRDRLQLFELGLIPLPDANLSIETIRVRLQRGGEKFTFRVADELAAAAAWVGPREETVCSYMGLPSTSYLDPNIEVKTTIGKTYTYRNSTSTQLSSASSWSSIRLVGPGIDSEYRIRPKELADLIQKTGSLWLAIFEYTETYYK